MKINQTIGWVMSAMFLALGLLFPGIFHFFGAASGQAFLPMHIPVFICGLFCGPIFGSMVGILTPLLSSFLTGMQVFFPTAIAMTLELATYGAVSGLLVKKLRLYPALIAAMLCGRVVSGIAHALLLSAASLPYTLETFINVSFLIAIPGIALQLVIVPLAVSILKKIPVIHR